MLDLAKAAIRTRMSQWTTTPVKWANQFFEAPIDQPWLAVVVDGGMGYNSGFGSPENRYSDDAGMLWIMAYTPIGSGDETASALLRQAGALFAMNTLETTQSGCRVHFETASFGGSGSGDEDGLWYMEALSIPFSIISSEITS